MGERQITFIDNVVGNSHVKIVKPANERRKEDADQLVLGLLGKGYKFYGIANDQGFLGKVDPTLAQLAYAKERTEAMRKHGELRPYRRQRLA
jgi:hypothetical protein